MSHACHRFWKCYNTFTFCSLLRRCTIPCACHTKRHLNVQKWSEPLVFLTFWLRNVLRATTACTFSTSQRPKVLRTPGVFNILTSKCASRHNDVHFFDISTSKSGPKLRFFLHVTFWLRNVFRATTFFDISTSKSGPNPLFFSFWLGNVLRATTTCTFSTPHLPKVVRSWGVLYMLHFDFEMCFAPQRFSTSQLPKVVRTPSFFYFDFEVFFAPQRRALFRHLNFQKWSECEVFLPFSLANVLRATTACTFSSLIWPDGFAPAALASLLFDRPQPQVIGKT